MTKVFADPTRLEKIMGNFKFESGVKDRSIMILVRIYNGIPTWIRN